MNRGVQLSGPKAKPKRSGPAIYLGQEIIAKVSKAVFTNGQSVNQWVREAVEQRLARET